jgi:hypothetical protein
MSPISCRQSVKGENRGGPVDSGNYEFCTFAAPASIGFALD